MTIARRMLEAFEGSETGYLVTVVGDKGKKGKTEAKYKTVSGQVTEELMQRHLDGVQGKGIGCVPIRVDVCKFGVIDIDVYDLDHALLQLDIQRLKMPLVHCRSKSGGAHLYLFLDDWESCAVVRELLEEMRSALGFSGSGELFPAQEKVNVEENQIGNGINIPYFNAELPTRYAYGPSMESLEVEEFLDLVEASRVSMASVQEIDFGGERKHFEDGPICLQLITMNKVTENRNIVMFNVGVYCKNKWPDDWEAHHEEYNRTLCEPPLSAKEILTQQGSLKKKEGYFYQCNQCPLKDFCNKAKCKMQKYGIGSSVEDHANISSITIMLSEPRLYFMSVDGKNLTLKSDELQNPHLWQKACMEQLDMMPPKPKNADWQQLINAMLSTATKQEVSKELTWAGKFENLLRQFCTSYVRAVAPEEVLLGKPWTDNGKTMFKIDALEKFLRNNDFTKYDTGQIQDRIQKLNGEGECHGKLNYYKEDGKRTTTRVWWVPEFEDEDVQIEIKEDKYDINF